MIAVDSSAWIIGVSRPEVDGRRNAALRQAGLE
jgi:hypothetical protein